MTVLILTVWILAVARLTRLVTADKITEPIRQWLIKRRDATLGKHSEPTYLASQLAYLVHCPWCSSMWLAVATAPAAAALTGMSWWLTPLLGLAASQLVGWASLVDADLDPD